MAELECTRHEMLDVNRAGEDGEILRWFSISKFTDGDVSLSFNQLGAGMTVNLSAEHAAALGRLLIEVAG